ncbi:MAG: hypothetical protein D6802_11330 [Ardenticatenia bacterium]|nr:MAG: hypothetical protein D6802_11330 [Ardenticatenia bacterium]
MSKQTLLTHLTPEVIMQTLYGDAPPTAYEHLAICPACQASRQEMRMALVALTQNLFRAPCPSPDELSEAAMQGTASLHIAQHLAKCADCRAEWHMLTHLAQLPLAQPSFATLTEALRAHMRVLRATPASTPMPDTAPLRGAQAIAPYLFHTDIADIMIGIAPSDEMPNRYQMQGMLINKTNQRLRNVLLYGTATPVLNSEIDDEALFAFDNLPTGTYNLLISDGETALYLPDIAIA